MTLTPSQTLNPKPYTLHPKPEKKNGVYWCSSVGANRHETGTPPRSHPWCPTKVVKSLHSQSMIPRTPHTHSMLSRTWSSEHHTHILCSHEPGRATSSDPSGSMRWQGCRTPAGGEYTLANWQHSTISLPSLSLWLLLTLSILMLLSSSSSLLLLLFVNVTITHYH